MIIDTRNWSPMSRRKFLWKIIKEIVEDWRDDINFNRAVKDEKFNKRIDRDIKISESVKRSKRIEILIKSGKLKKFKGGIKNKMKKAKSKKIGGIVAWIVATFKPEFHLAKNPPKGNKRKVAVKKEVPNG